MTENPYQNAKNAMEVRATMTKTRTFLDQSRQPVEWMLILSTTETLLKASFEDSKEAAAKS